MPLNSLVNNINNFTQWKKNGSVDVTFAREITHQKHLVQSGLSTRSAVDILLCIFTKEPIREQEIKLECMNFIQITCTLQKQHNVIFDTFESMKCTASLLKGKKHLK